MNLVQNFTQWRDRFFSSTRGRVVLLLRRGDRTVNDLADDLELTDNAVRAHLTSLERDGLVERAGLRQGGGKPSYTYQLTAEAESFFPKAYALVLTRLLEAVDEELDAEERDKLLRSTGQRLAASLVIPPELSHAQRVERAADVLTQLGGLASVNRDGGETMISGSSCPMLEVAAERGEVCQVAATLLSEIIGSPIDICCQRNGQPHCRFVVQPE